MRCFCKEPYSTIAGCDEAGRGCLAGPVFAAAVILPPNCRIKGLTDSKQLSKKKREKLRSIIEQTAIAWAVGQAEPEEIDRINILNASFLAMHRAIQQLNQKPDFLAIDGNRFKPYKELPHECIVKGDAKYLQVAAASVLAKTYRDNHMEKLHEQFPAYGWAGNKGYPTQKHREAILRDGTTPQHRMSFKML